MLNEPDARNNLMSLLRLAREEADDLRADLADVELAMASAEATLTALADQAPPPVRDGNANVCLERFRLRSLRLFAARETLAKAREDIRTKLEMAAAELAKLERLIAIGAGEGHSESRLTSPAPLAEAFAPARQLAS